MALVAFALPARFAASHATAELLHAAVTPVFVSEYAVGASSAADGDDGGGDHHRGLHLVGTSSVAVICMNFDRQLFALVAQTNETSNRSQGLGVVPLLASANPAASLAGVQLHCRRGGSDGDGDAHDGDQQLVFEMCDVAVRGVGAAAAAAGRGDSGRRTTAAAAAAAAATTAAATTTTSTTPATTTTAATPRRPCVHLLPSPALDIPAELPTFGASHVGGNSLVLALVLGSSRPAPGGGGSLRAAHWELHNRSPPLEDLSSAQDVYRRCRLTLQPQASGSSSSSSSNETKTGGDDDDGGRGEEEDAAAAAAAAFAGPTTTPLPPAQALASFAGERLGFDVELAKSAELWPRLAFDLVVTESSHGTAHGSTGGAGGGSSSSSSSDSGGDKDQSGSSGGVKSSFLVLREHGQAGAGAAVATAEREAVGEAETAGEGESEGAKGKSTAVATAEADARARGSLSLFARAAMELGFGPDTFIQPIAGTAMNTIFVVLGNHFMLCVVTRLFLSRFFLLGRVVGPGEHARYGRKWLLLR